MKKNNVEIDNYTSTRIKMRESIKKIEFFQDHLKIETGPLSISFISDDEMALMNRKYLSHEGTTDIITFDYSQDNKIIEGELLICVDEAKRQAGHYKVSLDNEITRLIFHGLLHLSGFDDTTQSKRKKMKEKENELLNLWK